MRKCLQALLPATALLLVAGTAAFAAAPSALYNKSITVSWAEARDMKGVDGHARHRVVHHVQGIYVSGNGRLFMQTSRVAHGGAKGRQVNAAATSHGPGGSMKTSTAQAAKGREVQMNGRSIVVMVKFDSGARRMEVKFDEGFRSCSVHVAFGKEEGAPGKVIRGMNSRLYMVAKTDVSSQSCSIRDGNMFGS
jgi:hypothetical protein